MPRARQPRPRRRYSAGEWYGTPFDQLTPAEQSERARREIEVEGLTGTLCPFQVNEDCSKKGGICSLRLYEQIGDGAVTGLGPLITTCPIRFLEAETIFQWVGETVLETSEPIILSQIGFLNRLKPTPKPETDEEDSRDFIGRIDNVLVHPSRIPIDWCAVELQAVYFSGKAMKQEFKMLSERQQTTMPFPAAHRRPDWRSSGPKRLLPQLQTKIPTIRTWGKKMAVVIDEAFFSSLVVLEQERYLSNAEIAWFVVRYERGPAAWKLTPHAVIFTQLSSSVKALTGGVPLAKEQFETQLRSKIRLLNPDHPVGRA